MTTPILTPRLFFGRNDQPRLLTAGSGYLDDTVKYDVLGTTNRIAPAGIQGECIFPALRLALETFDTTVRLKVTAIVDNTALASHIVDVVGSPGSVGDVKIYELDLSIPYLVGGVERLRYYPRGAWIQVKVETDSANVALAKEIVNEITAEYEVVRESRQPIAT